MIHSSYSVSLKAAYIDVQITNQPVKEMMCGVQSSSWVMMWYITQADNDITIASPLRQI